jgi:hypothetical protein
MNRQPGKAINRADLYPDDHQHSHFGVAPPEAVIDHFVVQTDGVVLPVYSTIPSSPAGATVLFAVVAIRLGD